MTGSIAHCGAAAPQTRAPLTRLQDPWQADGSCQEHPLRSDTCAAGSHSHQLPDPLGLGLGRRVAGEGSEGRAAEAGGPSPSKQSRVTVASQPLLTSSAGAGTIGAGAVAAAPDAVPRPAAPLRCREVRSIDRSTPRRERSGKKTTLCSAHKWFPYFESPGGGGDRMSGGGGSAAAAATLQPRTSAAPEREAAANPFAPATDGLRPARTSASVAATAARGPCDAPKLSSVPAGSFEDVADELDLSFAAMPFERRREVEAAEQR